MTDESAANQSKTPSSAWLTFCERAGRVLLAAWIFGSAAFFFVRFTSVFSYANQEMLNGLLRGGPP